MLIGGKTFWAVLEQMNPNPGVRTSVTHGYAPGTSTGAQQTVAVHWGPDKLPGVVWIWLFCVLCFKCPGSILE